MHNICVGMLKEGFHKSFNELFTLSTDRKMKRLEAGPDSIMWEVSRNEMLCSDQEKAVLNLE